MAGRRSPGPLSLSLVLLSAALGGGPSARAQGAPRVLWEVPNPSAFASSAGGVAFSPDGETVVCGAGDRNTRFRRAADGALLLSVLQPRRSDGVLQASYATSGAFVAIGNRTATLTFNVHRPASGALAGHLLAEIDARGVVRFSPDAELVGAGGGAPGLFRLAELTAFQTIGSGYRKVTTAFNLSPDGALQTATIARTETLRVQRTADGAQLQLLRGSAATFSPDGRILAVWSASPNQLALYRTSDWALLHTMRTPEGMDGGLWLRFTPGGGHLVTSGYLPFLDDEGLWQQKGVIRFFRVADGAPVRTFDEHTGIAVTTPVAFSPDGRRMLYGTYDGAVVLAESPL